MGDPRLTEFRLTLLRLITEEFEDLPTKQLSLETLAAGAISSYMAGRELEDIKAIVEEAYTDTHQQMLHLKAGHYNSETPEA